MSGHTDGNYCNANYGPEDIPRYETCGTCRGAGYSNHPDSGEICETCGGSGGVERNARVSGHTATPWEVIAGDDYYIRADAYPEEFVGRFKSDDTGPYVACVGNRPADFGEANAAFIVTACNSHADLVRALEEIRGGKFDGAGTLAVSGSWKLIVERLQKIAADALATLTARNVG